MQMGSEIHNFSHFTSRHGTAFGTKTYF